ncbi:MAG: hypothetical protein IKD37_02310 [Clostridia bacterium]|nr:hypothetical protein [Clostridia bacterium]
MVKGCQRRIILLRETGSAIFEEAYFLVKPEQADASEQRMIAEANRIIEENLITRSRTGRRRKSAWQQGLWHYAAGVCSGGALTGLLWALCQ